MQCNECNETRRPPAKRQATEHRAEKFNEKVFLDVFEVKLPDDSSCLLLMTTTGDASKYAAAALVFGRRNISTDAAIEGFTKGWLCWAGPPTEIQLDPAKAFSSARWENFVAQLGARPLPIPTTSR